MFPNLPQKDIFAAFCALFNAGSLRFQTEKVLLLVPCEILHDTTLILPLNKTYLFQETRHLYLLSELSPRMENMDLHKILG